MTAVGERAVTVPPRFFIRTAWVLHRALLRVSGGRVGLRRPAPGKSFGMLRLTTIGRRSGEPRVAIVGYLEDGANLVTLAMNGWAEAEPAWWLNLQAHPDTVVETKDGHRAVHARAADGDERDRLWALWGQFSENYDTWAAMRSGQTAVVVLEPRAAAVPNDLSAVVIRGGASGTTPRAASVARRRFHLRPRHLWIVPGLGLALYASQQSTLLGAGLVPLLLFGIAPDLPRLLGIGQPHEPGKLAPRVLPLFNPLHHAGLPVAILLGLAVTGISSPFLFTGALAWLGHIVVGWGTGDRRRSPGGPAASRSEVPSRTQLVPASDVARGVGG